MKLVNLYYDTIKINKKTHKQYHYVYPKYYTWIADDELVDKIANTKTPAMLKVKTNLKNKAPGIVNAFIINTIDILPDQEQYMIESHKFINHDDFKTDVRHATDKQQKRLDHLFEKLNLKTK